MKILADENIPKSTVETLRGLGHDVRDFRGTPLEGSTDEELWRIAQAENRLVVSTDKGFAHRRFEAHFGMLLIVLHQPNRQKIHDRIIRALTHYPEDQWQNQLVIARDTVQAVWRPNISSEGQENSHE